MESSKCKIILRTRFLGQYKARPFRFHQVCFCFSNVPTKNFIRGHFTYRDLWRRYTGPLWISLHAYFMGTSYLFLWKYEKAFWNRWTLGMDFGLGNAGLWSDISAQKHTEFGSRYITLGRYFRKYRSRVQHFRVQGPGPGSSDSRLPYEKVFVFVANIESDLPICQS